MDPRAAEGGSAVGWPRRCREERLWWRRGAKDPAVTKEREEWTAWSGGRRVAEYVMK